jgi:hypothetical protein
MLPKAMVNQLDGIPFININAYIVNSGEELFRFVIGPMHSKKWDFRFLSACHQPMSRKPIEILLCLTGCLFPDRRITVIMATPCLF